MTKGFWETLKKPFFVMAPMADVTDAAFRRMIAKYSRHGEPGGGPDVFYTEFVSCEGLCSPGRGKLLIDLNYSENEHPIVAQIFGSNPDHFYECAKLVKSLGFDGIDINMGCPDRAIEKQYAGAALIKDPARARALIRAAKEGGDGLPVSVKTRVGYHNVTIREWLPQILAEEPAAVTIHARTRKEMSKVPARWEHVAEAVKIACEFAERNHTERALIIGNGDVKNITDAEQKVHETGADGVMLGRAIFGNPWLFSARANGVEMPLSKRLQVMVEHTKLFEEILGDKKNFAIMKKHYKAYVTGFDGAKELRMKLMDAKDADEVGAITEHFLKSL
jgi:nifR3 family TIM-barrel protein